MSKKLMNLYWRRSNVFFDSSFDGYTLYIYCNIPPHDPPHFRDHTHLGVIREQFVKLCVCVYYVHTVLSMYALMGFRRRKGDKNDKEEDS